MDVFDLVAKITLDTSEYQSGLSNASAASKTFGGVAKGIGGTIAGVAGTVAAVGGAIAGAAKGIYDNVAELSAAGDEIDKESQKLGLSAEMYQKLSYAADLSGTSISNLKLGVKTITNDIADLAAGVEGAATGYEQLGVSFTDVNGNIKDTETVLMETISALADMEDETARNAAASDIFGRSYQELIPLLNSGSEGITEMMNAADEYGFVMSDNAVKASADFNDKLTTLQDTVDGVKTKLLQDFLPAISTAMEGISIMLAGNEGGEEKITEGLGAAVDNLGELAPRILTIAEGLIVAVSNVAPQILTALVDGVISALPALVPVALSIVEKLATAIESVAPSLLQIGISLIVALLNGAAKSLPALLQTVARTIITLLTQFVSNAPLILDAALGLIKGLADGIIEGIPMILEALPQIIQGIIDFVAEGIPEIINCVFDVILAILNAIPQIITMIATMIPEIITGLIGALLTMIPSIIEGVLRLISGILGALPQIIAALIEAIPLIIQGLIFGLLGCLPQLVQGIITLIFGLWTYLPQIIAEIVTMIPAIIAALIDEIKNAMELFKEQGKELGKKLKDGFEDAWELFKKKVKEFLTLILTTISNGNQDFVNAGMDMIRGLIKGVESMKDALLEKARSIANAVIDTFKGIFDIHSPSRVFMQIGHYLDEGLALGMDDGQNVVERSVNALADVVNGFDADLSTSAGTDAINGNNGGYTQIINVNQQIATADELARTARIEARYGLMRGFAIG